MNTYIVRLNINEAFAWDRVDDLGEYVRNIYLRLPKKAKGEDYLYRFSFLAFTLKAKSRQDVRRMAVNASAWMLDRVQGREPDPENLRLIPCEVQLRRSTERQR